MRRCLINLLRAGIIIARTQQEIYVPPYDTSSHRIKVKYCKVVVIAQW